MPKPTLEQIARLAGVHKSTVSRVLGRGRPYRSETPVVQRVRSIANNLGWSAGAGLAPEPRPWQVAALIAGEAHHWNGVDAPIVNNLARALHGHGLGRALAGQAEVDLWRRSAIPADIVGCLVHSCVAQEWELMESVLPKPCVMLNWSNGPLVNAVTMDDRGGTEAAMDHLLALGHRDIAFIAEPPRHGAISVRQRSFHDHAVAHGIRGRDVHAEDLESLLHKDPPTALVCVSCLQVPQVLATVARTNRSISESISLLALDDQPIAHIEGITSVMVDFARLALTAAELLDQACRGAPPQQRCLAERLVVRSSTRPPQDRGRVPPHA